MNRPALFVAALLVGCSGLHPTRSPSNPDRGEAPAESPRPGGYYHNRLDYERFRESNPELLEPNYLPFMVWKLYVEGSDDRWLTFCRWSHGSFPLAVYVVEPEIPEAMQDEFRPVSAEVFVASVERALGAWESELEGLVAFRRVDAPEGAALVLRLIGEEAPAPDPERRVLGTTPLGDACRVMGEEESGARLRLEFAVPELWIYIADEFGLLNPDQVERIALHEIGHALGMRGHSPVPADLMFEKVRDRADIEGLSREDVNSFVSLYTLPDGTVYRRVPPEGFPPVGSSAPPQGPPRLALAPHVDARLGFEIQLPEGWMRVETPTGLVAIDGVTWDYAASLQLIVRRFSSVDAYLKQHVAAHVRGGRILSQGPRSVAGHPAFHLVVESVGGVLVDHVTVIESGEGRVFIVIADCTPEACAAYLPWFEAALSSLEIWTRDLGSEDRDYRRGP